MATEEETDAATANFVYLRSDEHAWIPAKVVEHPEDDDNSNNEVTVKIPLYKDERRIVSDGGRTAQRFQKKTISLNDYSNHALPLQNVDENGNLLVVEDMVDLAFLHEVRFRKHLLSRTEKSNLSGRCLTHLPSFTRRNVSVLLFTGRHLV